MLLPENEFIKLIFLIAFAFMMLFIFFIIMILVNTRMRRKKEVEKLNAIITTQENERKRIAEDLHDEIGPMLSAIKLQINSFSTMEEELKTGVKEVSSHLDSVIQNIRGVVRNLSSSKLHNQGLIQGLDEFRHIIEKNNKIRFNLMHEGITGKWFEEAESNIYRIIYELINNSLKHSNCDEINIALRAYEKVCMILYVDNGTVQRTDAPKDSGSGLQNIQSRVRLLKGKLDMHPDFSKGAYYEFIFENKHLFQPA